MLGLDSDSLFCESFKEWYNMMDAFLLLFMIFDIFEIVFCMWNSFIKTSVAMEYFFIFKNLLIVYNSNGIIYSSYGSI